MDNKHAIMEDVEISRCLEFVCGVASEAGSLIRANWRLPKAINEIKQHDIKLKLDVECQALITGMLQKRYPQIALLGEEGCTGDVAQNGYRWVVDPIDGTVNFAFDIPHACVSIALQRRVAERYETVLGVVYDPFCKEMWTATTDDPARLNGEPIQVSQRSQLSETVISVGFAKLPNNLDIGMDAMMKLTAKVRKVRIMGSAALDLVYVASGRLDAYLEVGVRLWDIAAGGFIIERAGGKFHRVQVLHGEPETYKLVASNGKLSEELRLYIGAAFD